MSKRGVAFCDKKIHKVRVQLNKDIYDAQVWRSRKIADIYSMEYGEYMKEANNLNVEFKLKKAGLKIKAAKSVQAWKVLRAKEACCWW